MKFFLKMNPPTVTAQEHKVKIVHGRPMFYDPMNVKEARALITSHLMLHRPSSPIEGPIELNALWLFPKGKSHKHNEWRTSRPDTDNLQKLLKDCMTRTGFWKDDSQVVRETSSKKWSDEPCGIEIEILSLDCMDVRLS